MVSSLTISDMRASALSALAMTAFAANSVLCRLALAGGEIDAASFTVVRLVSGALALVLLASRICSLSPRNSLRGGDWISAMMLFVYAAAFSFAYLGLSAATGALILFGAVQLTMILGGLAGGERPSAMQWLGLVLAAGGLGYLLLPGVSAPPVDAALLMTISGVAWGLYSLRGRRTADPVLTTTGNFIRSVPFALALGIFTFYGLHLNTEGLLLAVASGALASGLGYVLWFAALRGLSATRAAAVQLSVPVLAAGGGFLFLSEPLTLRWILSTMAVLGGIALVLLSRRPGPGVLRNR